MITVNKNTHKNCRYCNYCKYFSTEGEMMWWFERNMFGPGICTLSRVNNYTNFYMSCDAFEYSPIQNVYNVETPEFVEYWKGAKKFQSDMYNDILELKARQRKENKLDAVSDYVETTKLVRKSKNIKNHKLNGK